MRPDESECICPKIAQSLGRFDGIHMGTALMRTRTVESCPVHDSCHGYTKEYRETQWNGEWLYCPFHQRKWCPS